MFTVPDEIMDMSAGLTKFNLILGEAVKQELLRPEQIVFYRQIWDRPRKEPYWSRHVNDLLFLLEAKAKERDERLRKVQAAD